MIIHHPLLGPRDAAEFVYLGDAQLIHRPDGMDENVESAFHDYLYLRDNPSGWHEELGTTSRVIDPGWWSNATP